MKKSTQFIIICTVFFLGITIFILLTKHKARPKKALIKKDCPHCKGDCSKIPKLSDDN